jgi:tRNA A58 N-methylase Trm61
VSLLDIHTKPWTEKTSNSAPSLQILEAGTGHGSLTLHVARAIAAANPPPLDAEVPPVRPTEVKRMASTPQAQPQDALAQAWTEWKQGRSAVLHTVEKVVANRYHAEKVVRGFRQGLYWPHVNFYAGDVKTWVQEQLEQRRGRNWSFSKAEPEFLDHVLLDMPGVHTQLKHVHAAMREGAKLVVFVPSITQIGECARVVQEGSLPLTMDKVVELGEGISNGRRWDVRMVMPRKRSDAAAESENEKSLPAGQDGDGTNVGPQDSEDAAPPSPSILDEAMAQDEPVMVCRPLVGERTFGGGFVALFRKVSPESAAMAAQWRRGQTGWARKRNRLSV